MKMLRWVVMAVIVSGFTGVINNAEASTVEVSALSVRCEAALGGSPRLDMILMITDRFLSSTAVLRSSDEKATVPAQYSPLLTQKLEQARLAKDIYTSA
ncbi:MAG: hypothetical protein HQL11_01790 [Candidatus Omnitrophica bacterium]|nr:hypothetical protein [Candidatus Omnitrophota bacterium]